MSPSSTNSCGTRWPVCLEGVPAPQLASRLSVSLQVGHTEPGPPPRVACGVPWREPAQQCGDQLPACLPACRSPFCDTPFPGQKPGTGVIPSKMRWLYLCPCSGEAEHVPRVEAMEHSPSVQSARDHRLKGESRAEMRSMWSFKGIKISYTSTKLLQIELMDLDPQRRTPVGRWCFKNEKLGPERVCVSVCVVLLGCKFAKLPLSTCARAHTHMRAHGE